MNRNCENEPMVQVTYTELEGLIRYSERHNLLLNELKYLIDSATLNCNGDELYFSDVEIRILMKKWLPNEYQAKIAREKIKEESEN